MQPYPDTKDSGLPWLGPIPAHWYVRRLKFVASVVNGATPQSGMPEYWDGDVSWVTPSDLGKLAGEKYVTHCERKITKLGLESCGTSLTPPGSVVLSTRAPIGHIAMTTTETCTNQGCKTITLQEKFNKNFAYFVLRAAVDELRAMGTGTTFMELGTHRLRSLLLPVPPPAEQAAIVAFLDRTGADIDRFLSAKRRLISLLREQKAALITQAVTHGLNPNVPTKPSGVAWLGDVPAHWDVRRLKFIASLTLGKMLQNDNKGSDFRKPYLRSANIQWEKPNLSDVSEMWFSKAEMEEMRLVDGDLLVNEGGEVGRACLWSDELPECYIQNSVHKVTPKHGNKSRFLYYQFFAMGSVGYVTALVNRVSIAHLTGEKLARLTLALPPPDEQAAIVAHIDREGSKIDKAIARTEREMELIGEYRAALIAEAVTGKIDVRNAAQTAPILII